MPASRLDKSAVIAGVCDALSSDKLDTAREMARNQCPFAPATNAGRRYTEYQMMRVFMRDGFIDRYVGTRLIFPGTLRLLSTLLPEEFPWHPNWKMTESHQAYWELFPTIDHAVPVARGGADHENNWVTTSMLTNAAKGSSTPDELGWTLRDPGSRRDWDGMVRWFLDYTAEHPEPMASRYLRCWRAAAVKVISELGEDS